MTNRYECDVTVARHPNKDYMVQIDGVTISSKLAGSPDARPHEVNSVIRERMDAIADFKKAPGASTSTIHLDESAKRRVGG